MIKRSVVGCAVTVTLATLCFLTLPNERALADNHGDAAASLLAADSAWSLTAQKLDKDAFLATVSSDGVILAPHQPVGNGPEAFEFLFDLPAVSLIWYPKFTNVASSGDLGYTYGTYDLSFDGPDGARIEDHGKYMTVWRKDESGAWRVVADMFNTSQPMPGAADAPDADNGADD